MSLGGLKTTKNGKSKSAYSLSYMFFILKFSNLTLTSIRHWETK